MSESAPAPVPAPEPAPNPALQRPPTGAPGGPPLPPTIPLTVDEYQRLRGLESQLAKFQAEQQALLDAKEAERVKALADAGKVQEALDLQQKQWSEKEAEATTRYRTLETQIFNEKISAALYEATSGKQFASDHAAQSIRQLLRDQLEARKDADGSIRVYEKGGHRPAAEMLSERLSDPSLAYFFAPTTRGGTGGDGARPPAQQQQPQPGSLEAIADEWKARQGGGFGLNPVG